MLPFAYNFHMALLVILEGPQCGRQFPLDGDPTVIGRDSSSQICLFVKAVSRRHAQIESQGSDFFLEDLGSNNGTFLNGERIQGRVPLKEHDRLTIGPYILGLLREADLIVRDQEKADTSNPNLYIQEPARKLQMVLEIAGHLGEAVELEPVLGKLLDQLLLLFPRAERGLVL